MKTRNAIYAKEAAELIRSVTMYKSLLATQIYRMFPGKESSIRNLLGVLTKQHRLVYNPDTEHISASEECENETDNGMISAFWVLLDFYENVDFHSISEYPVKLSFFSEDEFFEVIYATPGNEALMSHALSTSEDEVGKRIVIVEDTSQMAKLRFPSIACFCMITPEGVVDYYKLE